MHQTHGGGTPTGSQGVKGGPRESQRSRGRPTVSQEVKGEALRVPGVEGLENTPVAEHLSWRLSLLENISIGELEDILSLIHI